MKRLSVLIAFIALTGLSSAVVGGPNASDGEMAITSGSGSASATQSVGPNGTKWRTEIGTYNSSCMSGNRSQGIEFGDFSREENMTVIEFSGVLEASTPCHRAALNVSKTSEDVYQVEILEKSTDRVCTTCIGALNFEGSFAAPGEYRAVFLNDGEELGVKETSDYGEEEAGENGGSGQERSVWEGFSSIFGWLGSLF